MKAERWQQIEQLCQKARELEPNARLEFLKQACGDDKEFRQELESLLASDPKAGSFLERPTVETVATGVPEDLARSLVARIVQVPKGNQAVAVDVPIALRLDRARDVRRDLRLIDPNILVKVWMCDIDPRVDNADRDFG